MGHCEKTAFGDRQIGRQRQASGRDHRSGGGGHQGQLELLIGRCCCGKASWIDSVKAITGRAIAHYQILEKFGEGGMGVVYKARDTHLDRLVPVKLLPPERTADPERKRRFVREAKAASALNHPTIVTIHDISSEAGADFIVMEFVAGKPLDELIARKPPRTTPASYTVTSSPPTS